MFIYYEYEWGIDKWMNVEWWWCWAVDFFLLFKQRYTCNAYCLGAKCICTRVLIPHFCYGLISIPLPHIFAQCGSYVLLFKIYFHCLCISLFLAVSEIHAPTPAIKYNISIRKFACTYKNGYNANYCCIRIIIHTDIHSEL